MMGMGIGSGMAGGMWGLGMGLGIVLWIVLIAAVVWIVVQAFGRGGRADGPKPGSGQHDALVILKARYARGEISLEEYRTMREHIRS